MPRWVRSSENQTRIKSLCSLPQCPCWGISALWISMSNTSLSRRCRTLFYLPWLENSQEGTGGLSSPFSISHFLRVSKFTRSFRLPMPCLAPTTRAVLGLVKGHLATAFPRVWKGRELPSGWRVWQQPQQEQGWCISLPERGSDLN